MSDSYVSTDDLLNHVLSRLRVAADARRAEKEFSEQRLAEEREASAGIAELAKHLYEELPQGLACELTGHMARMTNWRMVEEGEALGDE